MKIICIGRNYAEHAKELGNPVEEQPVIFIKPDSALLKGNDFYLPEFSAEVHYEVELVVKISKGGKYIQRENVHKHYDEIGLGIDFTARDLQTKLKQKGLPWELAKGFDGSAVVSPFFPKEDYSADGINFQLKMNRETVQNGNSSNMIHNIEAIIAFVSQYFTLKTGDYIYTGTPAGVGKVSEGDVLEGFLEDKQVFSIKVH